MSENFQAVSFPTWCSLLSYMLRDNKSIHLVLCMTREEFTESLVSEISSSGHERPNEKLAWSILHPSLHLAKASQQIHLTFVPSLMHLRAHLSVLPEATFQQPTETMGGPNKGTRAAPVLAIVNPFGLHRATSEFSAQGLSRTLALAIDAAARTRSQLHVLEVAEPSGDRSTGHDGPGARSPWAQQVPLLDNSVRSRGGDDQVWAGRTVEYGRVLRTWCQLEAPRPS